jgi:hypothetical protein
MHVLNFYLTFQYTIYVVNNTQSMKLATGPKTEVSKFSSQSSKKGRGNPFKEEALRCQKGVFCI